MVTDTITIPAGSRVVGEVWSVIMGSGPTFSDINSPQVVVRVGEPGDQGIMEITDMLFTTRGPGQYRSLESFRGLGSLPLRSSSWRDCSGMEHQLSCTGRCWNVGFSHSVRMTLSIIVFLTFQRSVLQTWWCLGHESRG